MGERTNIEWTRGDDGADGATWNPVTGCEVISSGCRNCYAMVLAGTRLRNAPSRAGLTTMSARGPVWNGQVRFNVSMLHQPLSWRRPRRIFVCAHGDLFHRWVADVWLDDIFAVMALAPWHEFIVLTKRADRMRIYLNGIAEDRARRAALQRAINRIPAKKGDRHGALEWPLANVWAGVSVEDQERANERLPDLLQTVAAVRWVSLEPLLADVDLTACKGVTHVFNALSGWAFPHPALEDAGVEPMVGPRLNWAVLGGESGPHARHYVLGRAKQILAQLRSYRVPAFHKQAGDNPVNREGVRCPTIRAHKGGDPAEWPPELRIQESPFIPPWVVEAHAAALARHKARHPKEGWAA